jgi:hypothetical protein
MMVASTRIPAASPKARTRMSTLGVSVIDANEMHRMTAALVTSRPVRESAFARLPLGS